MGNFPHLTTAIAQRNRKVGDRIIVRADAVLGTPEAHGTIREVAPFGYVVHVDGDPADEAGPVNFDGEILCDMPTAFRHF